MSSMNGDNNGAVGELVVRLRGLPWSCKDSDIKEFLGPAGASVTSVFFAHNREGRPSGEAYVSLSNDTAYQKALAKDRDNMGHRYIEIFPSKKSEMEHMVEAGKRGQEMGYGNEDGIIRCRGLPFGCTKEEIANFFTGLEIAPNGIVLVYDHRGGKATGECFVCFVDKVTAENALNKHMQNIQHRYVEVFRSSQQELEKAVRPDPFSARRAGAAGWWDEPPRGPRMGGPHWDGPYGARELPRPGPYDRPGDYGMYRDGSRSVYRSIFDGGYGGGRMDYGRSVGYGDYERYGRGYGSSMLDGEYYGRPTGGGPLRGKPGGRGGYGVAGGAMHNQQHFGKHSVRMRGLPFRATQGDIADFFSPLRVAKAHIMYDESNRPSGEAVVEFYTHLDATEAMKNDRKHMGARYVELFIQSSDVTEGMGMLYSDFGAY